VNVLALEAVDFRNLERVLLEPHPRFNVLAGENGQGKTNLLEAVYLLGTLRSFRASKTEELVRFAALEEGRRARVRARVNRLGTQRLLEVELGPGQKLARVDGKAARAAQYFGGFNVVLFAPEDLGLVRGSPAARRRFLDRAIWNAAPQYLEEAQTYERVLKSRNALLRDERAAAQAVHLPEMLEVYDAQLARAAVPVITRRRALVAGLAARVQAAFARVSGGHEVAIAYESAALRLAGAEADEAAIEAAVREALVRDRRRDLARRTTSSGPHTDELAIAFDGREAAAYASQGQVRAIALGLKIAEIQHLTETLGDAPVLLLDDVSSELDARRNAQLFEFLSSVRCQAFVTTTSPAYVKLPAEAPGIVIRKDFSVVSGQIHD
jgi:DNA replication and repair protein RecF